MVATSSCYLTSLAVPHRLLVQLEALPTHDGLARLRLHVQVLEARNEFGKRQLPVPSSDLQQQQAVHPTKGEGDKTRTTAMDDGWDSCCLPRCR